MAKEEIPFSEFLSAVVPEYHNFVNEINDLLINCGYKLKIELKANGHLVSYSHPKTKKTLLNFLFRKNGLLVRIYADNCGNYSDFINALPEFMENKIEKSSICKRLINDSDCNSKCVKGYDFSIGSNHYQKCRYNCFQFEVTSDSIPVLADFIKNEYEERRAV